MKFFIIFALCATAAAAAAVGSYDPTWRNAETLKYENNNIGVDGFNYFVETSDGKRTEESGVLKNVGTENEAMEVRGSYSYTDNGVVYTVTYVANEKGFQPQGAHLPVPPSA